MDSKNEHPVPDHRCPGLNRANGWCDIENCYCPFERAILCETYESMLANGPVQLNRVDNNRLNPAKDQ